MRLRRFPFTAVNVMAAVTETLPTFNSRNLLRAGIALSVLGAIIVGAYALHDTQGRGAAASLSLLIGAALGIVFQRGRFCFYCITRDYVEDGDSTGMFSILSALAVGGVGYALVFGAFLPNAYAGRLPPDAHIGPVSWVVFLGAFVFGVGMVLSGACVSGHLYRLGEGYTRAPFALFGAMIGFGIGFLTWQPLYLSTIFYAPTGWLPATFGYGGALAVHLALLSVLAIFLLRALPEIKPGAGGKLTPSRIWHMVFGQRWNPLVTGAIVAVIGAFAYFRLRPLGVTSQIGSITRTAMTDWGLLHDRLNGLDTFAGCVTLVVQTITDNGFLIGGLVLGSFAVALLSGKFQLSRLTPLNATTALLGGVLQGWGSMIALGCTVGTLLSGISAFAVSGWVFGAGVLLGITVGVKLRLHKISG